MNAKSIYETLSESQLVHKKKLMDALKSFVPQSALERCAELIMYHKLHLHIEVERKGRYGDYSPHSGHGNRISVNHNLSQFEFLITFIHEVSHHTCYTKHGPHHEAHGEEWKMEFRINMKAFLDSEVFPYDLRAALSKHMVNPKYSQSADVKLLQLLKKYDKTKQDITHLSDLQDGMAFTIKNYPDSWMRRIKKMRTYALCESLNGKHKYKVHLMAEVAEFKADETLN